MKKNFKAFHEAQQHLLLVCTVMFFLLHSLPVSAQSSRSADSVVEGIMKEVDENSQLKQLAHELLDVIGPRLVGTPQMDQAHEWAISTFNDWGISAENQQFGEWRGWERGVSHIDMVYPRVKTLSGTQLSWSPSTGGKAIEGEVVILPDVANPDEFTDWLQSVRGKIVLVSMLQPTGRPDRNWEEYATDASFKKMVEERDSTARAWRARIKRTGYTANSLPRILDEAGAAAIIMSNWSGELGASRVFGTTTTRAPSVDVFLEDYGTLFRLTENGHKPRVRMKIDSKERGVVPTFNTIATIPGTELPDEYVILSAHLDSWEGGTGATDNGTGVIAMMEVARILKKVYPNPRRTILIGLWGGEEQGLNGSRAFVIDHPNIVEKTQVVLNLDNGTGRVSNIHGSGFLHSYDFITRWLSSVPKNITDHVTTEFPGRPIGGNSDHTAFISAGIPGYMLGALRWGYRTITWHTNLDTYDKLIFDDLHHNVILTAIMAYRASEEPELVNREKSILPMRPNGKQMTWPQIRQPRRTGGF